MLRPHPARRTPRAVALALPARPQAAWPRLLAAALLALAAACSLRAQVAINTTGAPPAGNAMLDLQSTTLGLLIPRMTAAQRTSLSTFAPGPPSATLDGLLVYQTDSVGFTPRGFYYYDNSTPTVGWRHIAWGGPNWVLGGNAGTTAANFLGTLNNMPLVFDTHSQERGRVAATGEFQLYYTAAPAPTELMEVQGGIKLDGGSEAVNHEGTIRYTPAAGQNPGKFEGYVVNTPVGNTAINGWKQIDNNFQERKIQDSPIVGVGCQDPTNVNMVPAAVTASPRPWPSPGPSVYVNLGGPQSPYYSLWEDSHRQYLYQGTDLAAAGICPGPSNPIRAIAFNATGASGGSGRIHFLMFRMKNTGATNAATFDMGGLSIFAMPSPPNIPGPPPSYTAGHTTGYLVTTGWNVHPYDQGPGGFVWGGGNLLIDASVDDQDWGFIPESGVDGYTALPQSSIYVYCDACGNTGPGSCKFTTPSNPPMYYYPPTTPTNGQQSGAGANAGGWGWYGGWTLTTQSTLLCDGTLPNWSGSGGPTTFNLLPRVAFLCAYTGGGPAFNVDDYMVAQDGVMIGDAAWAATGAYPNLKFRGPGTISAKRSVWSNASLLSDFVFDQYYTGTTQAQDAEGAAQYLRTPLAELPNYVEQNRHLPTIPGRKQWEQTGTFSVDKLTNGLWMTVEDQALYIKELNERMDALQQFLVEKKLKELEKK
jgi:hypothetical protein